MYIVRYSFCSCAALVASAAYFWERNHYAFYPTVVEMVTSKVSVLVLSNMAVLLAVSFWRILKTLFLGSLRDPELEAL